VDSQPARPLLPTRMVSGLEQVVEVIDTEYIELVDGNPSCPVCRVSLAFSSMAHL
jgi:hypothetical protein